MAGDIWIERRKWSHNAFSVKFPFPLLLSFLQPFFFPSSYLYGNSSEEEILFVLLFSTLDNCERKRGKKIQKQKLGEELFFRVRVTARETERATRLFFPLSRRSRGGNLSFLPARSTFSFFLHSLDTTERNSGRGGGKASLVCLTSRTQANGFLPRFAGKNSPSFSCPINPFAFFLSYQMGNCTFFDRSHLMQQRGRRHQLFI